MLSGEIALKITIIIIIIIVLDMKFYMCDVRL